MSKCFNGKEWICVLNLAKDKFSDPQLEILKSIKKEKKDEEPIKVIDCSDSRNEQVSLCSSVNAFPAFCSKKENKCLYGMKRNIEELESVCLTIKNNQ